MANNKQTQALVTELYPKVEKVLSASKTKYIKCLSNFIEKRSKDLFDTVPCSRIYYTDEDRNEFFSVFNINPKEVEDIISRTYYGNITDFNPRAAKDPTTVTALMVIRYFYIKNMKKELELACTYFAFSGKIYPSLHYRSFNIEPARYVMEWVINNRLSQKYDIVSEGSIFGAVKSICNTWLKTYGTSKLKSKDDEDMVYIIQQLHNRIGSFMINIAQEYYEAYKNKDEFIVYDSDNVSPTDNSQYHLADSDSLRAQRIIERSMEKINISKVDYRLCKMCSDENIKTDEIKSIIEAILMDRENIEDVKKLITILVSTYFIQSKTKDVRDIDFITFSVSPKPNSKDPNILELRNIIEEWLTEKSKSYIRRKSRIATKNSYHRAVLMYFTLVIHMANK